MLNNKVVGIIGFGHLGHSLAAGLVGNGFQKERLIISHRGNKNTAKKARNAGFANCLASNTALARQADIVLMAARPQNVLELADAPFKSDAMIISFMAGLPLDLLQAIFGKNTRRAMCSGPETILEGSGIATLCPEDERVAGVLESTGMKICRTSCERELDSFTAGICLPAILLNIHVSREEIMDAMEKMRASYPVYGVLQDWIKQVSPGAETGEKREYLANVSTKGGISEAITTGLRSGSSLIDAIRRGLARGDEITGEIKKEILESMKLAG